MLAIQVLVPKELLILNNPQTLTALEIYANLLIGSVVKISMTENGRNQNCKKIVAIGTILPECDNETEIPDQRYHALLKAIGESLELWQGVFPNLEIETIVNFNGMNK